VSKPYAPGFQKAIAVSATVIHHRAVRATRLKPGPQKDLVRNGIAFYCHRFMSGIPTKIELYKPFKNYGGIKTAYLHVVGKFKPNQISRRRELGILLNAQGLTGRGAEIGVKEGKFSERILHHWRGELLYSIDPWKEFSEESYRDAANVGQQQQDAYHAETQYRLSRFGNRSKILRLTSAAAAREIADGSLDFAYLDAQHHYEAVKEDIELWYPKVKSGGILCGHDYYDVEEKDPVSGIVSVFEVKRAVDEFARNTGVIFFPTKKDKRASWFVRKP
jgi:hypothetical protein